MGCVAHCPGTGLAVEDTSSYLAPCHELSPSPPQSPMSPGRHNLAERNIKTYFNNLFEAISLVYSIEFRNKKKSIAKY